MEEIRAIEDQHEGWYGPRAVGGGPQAVQVHGGAGAQPDAWAGPAQTHVGRPSGCAGARPMRIFHVIHVPCLDRAVHGRLHEPRRHLP